MKLFTLVISTPDGNSFEDNVVSISVRGNEGDLAVLAGHIPFVTSFKPCICLIKLENGRILKGKIGEGILAVSKSKTTLLSDRFSLE